MSKRIDSLSESTWRVFCAVEIPVDVRKRIGNHAEQLREALPDVQASWTKPDNIHLTLKFFGNISQKDVMKASAAASRAARSIAPFTLTIEEPGAFPDPGPARVLWIGINDSNGNLTRLQREFDEECATEGFTKELREFHAHLTVARLRNPRGARRLADKHRELGFGSVEIEVMNLVLFRSELSPKGSKYSVISMHPLGALQTSTNYADSD